MTRSRNLVLIGEIAGFTLLELMIAMFVFTIGVLATLSMQVAALKSNGMARETTEAASLAADMVEQLSPLDYDQAEELGEGNHAAGDIGNYAISYLIQRDAIVPDTMLITVTVAWSSLGRQRTVSIDYIKPNTV